MARARTWLSVVALTAALAVPLAGDERKLNRSLYVPVEFSTCEHLEGAVLYRGDAPLQELPGRHVFQFTYYPNLGQLLPEFERVRISGTREGEAFEAGVVVTPASVYVGKKRIALDVERHQARFRRSLDARHESVELKLRCEHLCPREDPSESRRRRLSDRP